MASKAKSKKMSKAKARRATNDPRVVAKAVAWYRGSEDRTLRQACAKFRSISFERLRKAALAGKRRRSA